MKKNIAVAVLLVLTSACTQRTVDKTTFDENQRIEILSRLNDYPNLIQAYRKKLQYNDNYDDWLKLSQYYYKIEDYNSCLLYLTPLIKNNTPYEVNLLYARTLIELRQTDKAVHIIDELIEKNSLDGEVWNLKGISEFLAGRNNSARDAFNVSRSLFYNEVAVINNLAMLSIMNNDFSSARDLLLPLYSRGQYDQRLVYNLVYTLVKLNKTDSALQIIHKEKLHPGDSSVLLSELAKVTPKVYNVTPVLADNESRSVTVEQVENVKSSNQSAQQSPLSGIVAAAPLASKNAVQSVDELVIDEDLFRLSSATKTVNHLLVKKLPSGERLTFDSNYPLNIITNILDEHTMSIYIINAKPGKALIDQIKGLAKKSSSLNFNVINNVNNNDMNLILKSKDSFKDIKVVRGAAGNKKVESLSVDVLFQ